MVEYLPPSLSATDDALSSISAHMQDYIITHRYELAFRASEVLDRLLDHRLFLTAEVDST